MLVQKFNCGVWTTVPDLSWIVKGDTFRFCTQVSMFSSPHIATGMPQLIPSPEGFGKQEWAVKANLTTLDRGSANDECFADVI